MKHFLKLIVLILAMIPAFARAHEGMWLVSLLNKMNEAEMQGMGLNLTAEEIYSVNNASLKDAIVRLNYGQCTGEVVSDKSLIFTNHHCGFDAIQTLSTVQNNLLVNGFCAKTLREELPIPDFKISFLVRIDDVTKEMMEAIPNGTSEVERAKIVAQKTSEVIKKYGENGKYEVEVKSFYYGNEYYIMVYETFSDIRLVGNPPESVGKFGGDTDNWMWPRHTGDFSMLRIYADTKNNPAEYNQTNVPYKPKHFLPVNIDGIEEGDFSMIMGFPGRTSRYLTSYGVNQATEVRNPAMIACYGTKLESWKSGMEQDPAINLMYAAKYATTANSWKYYIGQTRGLKKLRISEDKTQIEKDFIVWANQNDARKRKYGETLTLVKRYYEEWDPSVVAYTYANLAGSGGAEFMAFAQQMGEALKSTLAEPDGAKKRSQLDALKPAIDKFFIEYDENVDKEVFINLTTLYLKNIKTNRPEWCNTLQAKYKGNVRVYAEKLFETSIFTNKARLMEFLNRPSIKIVEKDMGFYTASSATKFTKELNLKNPTDNLTLGMRLFVAGLREMNPDKAYAPDANSTMRLTYGVVDDYRSSDAVRYDYYTSASGILEKRDNSNPEFFVSDKLARLIQDKDYGRYATKGKDLVTCFVSNNDITGGNSGSPVIDGDGSLIGIAFDGNWEAMSGDIAFEHNMQRTISVDIRYVLFTIEKLLGGKNIIDELKFVKKVQKPAVATKPDSSKEVPLVTTPAGNPITPSAVRPGEGTKLKSDNSAIDAERKKADALKTKEQLENNKKEAEKKKAETKKKADELNKNIKPTAKPTSANPNSKDAPVVAPQKK